MVLSGGDNLYVICEESYLLDLMASGIGQEGSRGGAGVLCSLTGYAGLYAKKRERDGGEYTSPIIKNSKSFVAVG